jgi:hypothetical protein
VTAAGTRPGQEQRHDSHRIASRSRQGPASGASPGRGLAGTFLLGMAVNLIGLPSQTRSGAHIASLAFHAAHLVTALGMVLGVVMLLRAIPAAARGAGGPS